MSEPFQGETFKQKLEERKTHYARLWWGVLIFGILTLAVPALVAFFVFSVNPISLGIVAGVGLLILGLALWWISGGPVRFASAFFLNLPDNSRQKLWETLKASQTPGLNFLCKVEAVSWRLENLMVDLQDLSEKDKHDLRSALAYRIKYASKAALDYTAESFKRLEEQAVSFEGICDALGLLLNENENDIPLKADEDDFGAECFGSTFYGRYGNEEEAPANIKHVTREECRKALGIPQDADEAAIRRTFRKLALRYHPDKGGNNNDMDAITQCYEQLTKKDAVVVSREKLRTAASAASAAFSPAPSRKTALDPALKLGDATNLVGYQ